MALGEKLRNARLNAKLTTAQISAATRMKVQIVEDIERDDFRRIAAPIYGKGFIRLYAERVGLDPAPLLEEYMGRFVNPVQIKLATEKSNVLQASNKLEELAPHQIHADVIPEMPKEQDLFSASPAVERAAPAIGRVPPRHEDRLRTEEVEPSGGTGGGLLAKFRKRIDDLREQVSAINDPWRRRDFSLPVIRFVESPVKWLSVLIGTLIIFILLLSTISRMVHRAGKETAPAPRVEEPREQLRLGQQPSAPYVE